MNKGFIPKALLGDIDTLTTIQTHQQPPPSYLTKRFHADHAQAVHFLLSYQNNKATFLNFRREIERFLQWSCFFAQIPLKKLTTIDIENYLHFCRKPPASWIALKTVSRFIKKDGNLKPNPNWRPFVVKQSKTDHADHKKLLRSRYQLSEKGIKEIFTILNCFYKHMIQHDYLDRNIIDLIKQKSRFYRTQQMGAKVRRISNLQWDFVIEAAEHLADQASRKHERTLFIITLLYGLYLRVSELVANDKWTPMMDHFYRDQEDNWWFKTVGKGHKERHIAVSDAVLKALIRWRKHLDRPTPCPCPMKRYP